MSGMEVWGDLTLRGSGSLTATGSQCGTYVSGALAVDGCEVDARADGTGIADARVTGVIAGGLAVRGGVVDADGTVAARVVIEPEGATAPAGESDTPSGEVSGGEPAADVDPAIGGAAAEQATHPTVKPAVATKTTTTTAVTKTKVAKASNPRSATATSSSLPKTADSYWAAVSAMLFLLGTALLAVARRC